MNVYIDCEFNGFEGDLISMALCSESGKEFYEVLDCENIVDWVSENVMPILGKPAIDAQEFQCRLSEFLNQFDSINIIADWPDDISYFCKSLITAPAYRIDTPPLSMQIIRVDAPSDLPHNALYDARGLMKYLAG